MTGVILTGGKSSRMGQDKALMQVGGVPLFRRILEALDPLFDEILIITDRQGRHADIGYREVTDLIPDCGPLGGIYTGLHYAKSDQIFVASCDLPFINSSVIQILMEEAGNYDIVVPDVDGRLHPLHATYSKRCGPYIRKWLDNGLFNITKFINDVEGLSVRKIQMPELITKDPELMSLFNMNTQEDWLEANKSAGKTPSP